MSLPFYGISCSSCDFVDSFNYSIEYVYRGSPEKAPALEVAYCATCNRIVMACVPFARDSADREATDLGDWVRKARAGLFWSFSKARKSEIAEAERWIEAARLRASFFEAHTFKVRCLECTGPHVSPVSFPFGEHDNAESMGIKHICGGELMAAMKARLAFGRRVQVIYDDSGTVVLDERGRR